MTQQQHARALRAAFAFTIAALAVTGPAAAAGYPEHPVTVVVPYPPGGGADLFGRAIARALEPGLKQAVLVENRPGRAAISAWPTWRGPRPTATRWALAPSARKASIPSCTPT